MGLFWVVELKRDPHAPFDLCSRYFLFKFILRHDTAIFADLVKDASHIKIKECPIKTPEY